MTTSIFSCSFNGIEGSIIEVEAHISNGLPAFHIVGLGDASVQESRERIRSSIKNSGLEFPRTHKTINLAPAELRKQGSLFDLPIAISILLSTYKINEEKLKNAIVIGELSLNGKVKAVKGVLALAKAAKKAGFQKIFLSKDNAKEASFINELEVIPVKSLKELLEFCKGNLELKVYQKTHISNKNTVENIPILIGMEKEKRALEIAITGSHNILFNGSPGCGKTAISRYAKHLLPDMTKKEILETTTLFSVSGLLNKDNPLIKTRPFREVHHTASLVSIIGGGNKAKPGEISLSHNGVLFLDEIAEFPKKVLESLRQPLEDKYININRIKYSHRFPSDFTLIATMNPCPCGYTKNKKVKCKCSDKEIQKYQNKISGPLKDRFDIFINVEKKSMKGIFNTNTSEINIKSKINTAHIAQQKRNIKNSNLSVKDIQKYCKLDQKTQSILDKAMKTLHLSNRAYLKIIKISRTIADLEASETIKLKHLTEAIQYRST